MTVLITEFCNVRAGKETSDYPGQFSHFMLRKLRLREAKQLSKGHTHLVHLD